MTNLSDPRGAVDRYRRVADCLSNPQDAAIVRQYASELERKAFDGQVESAQSPGSAPLK